MTTDGAIKYFEHMKNGSPMSGFITACDTAIEALKAQRHGVWFGTVCSCCGKSTSFYYDCNYCPNCGAKMDEE